MLTAAAAAQGQSTLIFPQALPPASLATNGFAIVNPGSTSAAVAFTMYGASGQVLGGSQQMIPAGGQLARLASELFPGVLSAGWVQVSSPASGLQGLWVGGDFSTYTDGAEPAQPATEVVFPLVTPTSSITLANNGDASINVFLRLFGADGNELGPPALQPIPPKGFFGGSTSSLFPTADLVRATHLRATSAAPFAGVLVARDFLAAPSWSVVNAVDAASSATELRFPHAIDGALGAATYTSVLGITNLATFEQDVTITFTRSSGAPLVVQQTLPGNGGIRQDLHTMFGLPGLFQDGWIQVKGTLPLAGVLTYAELSAGGVAAVPGQTSASKNLFFSHIADLAPWLTGLALLNSGNSTANVEVFALAPDGSLIGGAGDTATARIVLPPGSRVAKLLRELIPQTQTRVSDGGFIFVRSDLALHGIALFFDRGVSILANIPAAALPPGASYTPPQR